jgi:erythromycin esterase-like protein
MNSKLNLLHLIFFTIIFSTAHSQTTNLDNLNLDFEMMEGINAKGWADFKNPNYVKGLDTLIAFSGKNSGYIESKKDAKTFGALSYYIPAGYIGDKIKLTGYMKTENVSYAAGLWMKINPNLGFYNMLDKEIKGTNEWNEYEIELDYKDVEAESIEIGGLLAGKGKIWIDNLKVTIDGKELKNVDRKTELTTEVKLSLINKIQGHKTDLDISTEKKLDQSLTPLIESLGDKKIVSIGEDTHGTSEYYEIREAITKRLISEKGFNVVVLENPYDDIEMLKRDLKNKDLSDLMQKHLFSIYQTQEMKSFLNWYKNNSNDLKVKFKGCDDSFWVLYDMLENKLSDVQNKEILQLVEKISDASSFSIRKFNRRYKNSEIEVSNEFDLGSIVYQTTLDLENKLSAEDLLTPELEEYLFNIKTTYLNDNKIVNKLQFISRDELMAKRIAYLAQDPEAKLIVWAHNAHISRTVVMDGEIGMMGRKLKEEYGDDYHAIGLSSLSGSYSHIKNRFINDDHSYNEKLKQNSLNYQPKNSWESTLSEIDDDAFYFDTQDFKDEHIYTNLKLLGYGEETKNDYYKLSPLEMFDSLFFIKTTKATTPLNE